MNVQSGAALSAPRCVARAGAVWGLLIGLCGAVAASGCDSPQAGSPGFEPPVLLTDAGVHGLAGNGPIVPVGNPSPGGAAGSPGNTTGGQPRTGGAGAAPPPPAATDGSSDADADAGAEAGDTTDPFFVGLWVVDQPAHALYEASLYELVEGGTLSELDTFVSGTPPYMGFTTGSVAQPTSGVRCNFRGGWRSTGTRVLEVDAQCTDGKARSVELALPDGDPTTALVPTIQAVDGEQGWAHPGPMWSFHRCASRTHCPPF